MSESANSGVAFWLFVVISIVAGSAFGEWQQSAAAGWWMGIVVFIVLCAEDGLSDIAKAMTKE